MKKYGLTLIELLITVLLVGLVVLSFVSVQRFAFHNIIAAERRAKLQNEGFLILEYITKDLMRAKGYPYCSAPVYCAPVVIGSPAGPGGNPYYLQIRLDDNQTGEPNIGDDYLVSYRWIRQQVGAGTPDCNADYSLSYCPNSTFSYPTGGEWPIGPGSYACVHGPGASRTTLSCGKVANFTAGFIDNTTIMVNLTMRDKPLLPASIDNPEVNLTTSMHVLGAPAR